MSMNIAFPTKILANEKINSAFREYFNTIKNSKIVFHCVKILKYCVINKFSEEQTRKYFMPYRINIIRRGHSNPYQKFLHVVKKEDLELYESLKLHGIRKPKTEEAIFIANLVHVYTNGKLFLTDKERPKFNLTFPDQHSYNKFIRTLSPERIKAFHDNKFFNFDKISKVTLDTNLDSGETPLDINYETEPPKRKQLDSNDEGHSSKRKHVDRDVQNKEIPFGYNVDGKLVGLIHFTLKTKFTNEVIIKTIDSGFLL